VFLLVPAYPGCPGTKDVKRLLLLFLLYPLLPNLLLIPPPFPYTFYSHPYRNPSLLAFSYPYPLTLTFSSYSSYYSPSPFTPNFYSTFTHPFLFILLSLTLTPTYYCLSPVNPQFLTITAFYSYSYTNLSPLQSLPLPPFYSYFLPLPLPLLFPFTASLFCPPEKTLAHIPTQTHPNP